MIKSFFTFLFLSFIWISFAQVAEDFSDGDFTNNPVWSGDDALFTVNGGQLNSQSPGANTYYLSTPSSIASDAEWEFWFDFQFGTSGANFAKIYLMSDNANLNLVSNGYFVLIGNTVDEISLYKVVSGVETVVIDGPDGLINSTSSNPFRVKVTRDISNNWTLQYDDLGSSPTGGYVSAGTANDNSVNSSTHFGFWIEQSSAASPVNSHFFDDITVQNIAPDITAPAVTSVNVISSTELEVLFDEPVDINSAQTLTNYLVNNGVGNPNSAVVNGSNPALVDLTFSNSFNQGITHNIVISNVEDLASNAMVTSNHDFLFFVPVPAVNGDVLINEIFADPSPQIGLPASEYVEIINVSNKIFDLNGWSISDGSSSGSLTSYLLMPGEVVAITDDNNQSEFSFYPNITYVSSFPSLNNSSDNLKLFDDVGTVLDSVNYTDDWYQDGVKDDGGYSLELINPLLPCSGAANWIASNDPNGGTPGAQNSVYDTTPDVVVPTISNIQVNSNIEIELCFSEGLDTTGINASYFSIDNGLGVAFFEVSGDLTCVTITTTPALDTGLVYTLTVNGVADCSGNTLTNGEGQFVLPHLPDAGDIILNEIMWNPFTGGDDFVEIYNNSDKYIDLFEFKLANWDDGVIDNYKDVEIHRLIGPKEFVVFTKDSVDIKANYLNAVPGSFIELSSMPSYPDDSATVYLILPDSSISDRFQYDDDYHFALLEEDDGVSLERVDYDRPTSDITNWKSAAENVGWATPGLENSQLYQSGITEDNVSTSPEIFSPDNDGFEDLLNINYSFEESGYVGNVTIYDRSGRIVKYLMRSEYLAQEGIISWDGITNSGDKANIGVYVIVFEVFNLEGKVSIIKKSTILGGKF